MTYDFRKVDGVWQRRETKTREWKTLRVETVEAGRREKYRRRNGEPVTVPVYARVWSWE